MWGGTLPGTLCSAALGLAPPPPLASVSNGAEEIPDPAPAGCGHRPALASARPLPSAGSGPSPKSLGAPGGGQQPAETVGGCRKAPEDAHRCGCVRPAVREPDLSAWRGTSGESSKRHSAMRRSESCLPACLQELQATRDAAKQKVQVHLEILSERSWFSAGGTFDNVGRHFGVVSRGRDSVTGQGCC